MWLRTEGMKLEQNWWTVEYRKIPLYGEEDNDVSLCSRNIIGMT